MQKFYKPSQTPKMFYADNDMQYSKPILVYLKSGDVRIVKACRFDFSDEVKWRTHDSEQFEINVKSIDHWTYAQEKPSIHLSDIIHKFVVNRDSDDYTEGIIRNCRYRIFGRLCDSNAKGELHLACNDSFDRWANSKSISIDYNVLFHEDKVDLYNAVENLVAIFDRL